MEDKAPPFHYYFWTNLVSWKKWRKKVITNIEIIISHRLCIATLQMHYKLLTHIFRRNIINRYCQLNFTCARFSKVNYFVQQLRFSLVKVSFCWQVFISIAVTFILNIIVVPKITYSDRFMTIMSLFKKDSNILSYYLFNCFILFF